MGLIKQLTTMDYTNTNDIRKHLLAGASEFSLLSLKTGVVRGYRVVLMPDSKPEVYYVYESLKTMDVYIGVVTTYGILKLKHTKKSNTTESSVTWIAFTYLLSSINKGSISKNMQYIPSVNCCVCGRKLNDPDSIKRGVGPECIKKL